MIKKRRERMIIEEIKKIIADDKDTRPHFERIKQLIEQEGGNNLVNQTGGKHNRTLLWNAAQFGDLKLVRFLIQHGANVHIAESTRNCGWTPLHIGARNNHLEIIKYLIQVGGARVNEMDKSNRTALSRASENGCIDVVKYLIEEAGDTSIDQTDKHGLTPLWWASFYGHLVVVKYLLEMGANHLIADRCGTTPLYVAQQYGQHTIVKLLNEYNQEKMKEGEEKRKKIQAEAKRVAQKKQQTIRVGEGKKFEKENSQENSFDHCQAIIQSGEELDILIEYLSKRLHSISNDVDQHELYGNQFKQWFVLHKIKRDNDEDGALLPHLKEMKMHMDRIKISLDESIHYSKSKCLEKLASGGSGKANDDDNIGCKENGDDNNDANDAFISSLLSHSRKLKGDLDVLYSVYIKAQHAYEQRSLAIGHCF